MDDGSGGVFILACAICTNSGQTEPVYKRIKKKYNDCPRVGLWVTPLMMLVFKIPFAASMSIQSQARATVQNKNQREKFALTYPRWRGMVPLLNL